MNSMKNIAIAVVVITLATAPVRAADFLVNIKALCTGVSYDDSTGKEKLEKSSILRTQILQMCADTHPELNIEDVELTYDSDFQILHVIRKCDGTEVCEFGTGFCVQAFNSTFSGATEKLSVNSVCVLELFFFSDEYEVYGTALGKEKIKSEYTDDVETKLGFKGSYQGQFEFFTLDDAFVCALKFSTGTRFEPTGAPCPE